MKKTWAAAATAAMLALTGTAQAALVIQANGVEVLDTATNLLWLRDWGQMTTWTEAKSWAASLTLGGATAGDWRLPVVADLTTLVANVGDLRDVSEFTNVSKFRSYWTSEEWTPGLAAKTVSPPGIVGSAPENANGINFAVAVRTANVAPPPSSDVPEPQSLALALVALGAAALTTRRRAAGPQAHNSAA